MAVEIKVPALGESVNEATVAKWFKAVGDSVAMDEPIVELETDKVTLEVPAGAAGTLSEMRVAAGETVTVGAVLGIIGGAGAPKAAVAAAPAPVAVKASPPPAAPPPPAAKPATAPTPGPAARKMMAEAKLEPSAVAGTGKDGRVTKGDVMARDDQAPAPAARPAPAPAPVAETRQIPRAPGEREERVRMTRLRKRIAERLKYAQDTAAILTTFNEIDMSPVMELRRRHKEAFEKQHGVALGFMSFFVKACCAAARAVPELNAQIQGDELVYREFVHMGVAVGTEHGLVVPVVRNADQLSFAGIETEIARLAALARDGHLMPDHLSGATFTISNGGVYGSLLSTPILNPPQSGILGMHKIEKRPIVVNDEIVVRPMMYLALSYDHRVVDGKGAVTFLVRVKEALEDPSRLLLGI